MDERGAGLDPAFAEADVAVLKSAVQHLLGGPGSTGKKYDFRVLAAYCQPGAAQTVIHDKVGPKSFEEIRDKKMPIRIAMFEFHQLATAQVLAILKSTE